MALTQEQINEYIFWTEDCLAELQRKHDSITTRLTEFKTTYGTTTGKPNEDIKLISAQELDTRKLVFSKLKAEIDNMRSTMEKKLMEVDGELVRRTT